MTRTKMATKEKSGQLKMPAFQETTCWKPGMTGCDLHRGVLTLWSVDAASKHFSFGQICSSSPAGGKEILAAGANKGFKLGQRQL